MSITSEIFEKFANMPPVMQMPRPVKAEDNRAWLIPIYKRRGRKRNNSWKRSKPRVTPEQLNPPMCGVCKNRTDSYIMVDGGLVCRACNLRAKKDGKN